MEVEVKSERDSEESSDTNSRLHTKERKNKKKTKHTSGSKHKITKVSDSNCGEIAATATGWGSVDSGNVCSAGSSSTSSSGPVDSSPGVRRGVFLTASHRPDSPHTEYAPIQLGPVSFGQRESTSTLHGTNALGAPECGHVHVSRARPVCAVPFLHTPVLGLSVNPGFPSPLCLSRYYPPAMPGQGLSFGRTEQEGGSPLVHGVRNPQGGEHHPSLFGSSSGAAAPPVPPRVNASTQTRNWDPPCVGTCMEGGFTYSNEALSCVVPDVARCVNSMRQHSIDPNAGCFLLQTAYRMSGEQPEEDSDSS